MTRHERDWETLFEADLIPLVQRAASPVAMRRCAEAVVQALYRRDADVPVRDALMSELAALTGAPEDAERILALLRNIKDQRVQRARHGRRIDDDAADLFGDAPGTSLAGLEARLGELARG